MNILEKLYAWKFLLILLLSMKTAMKNIMMIIGITAWIACFIALYNNNIDYAILFALFAHIFNSESEYYNLKK